MDLHVGENVEKYTVEGLLGEGGMAKVYRVRHQALDTVYALKLLTTTSTSVRKRLLMEGRTQAKLRHTNIVAVTDVLDLPIGPGLILEFVRGSDLDDLVTKQPLTLAQIDDLARGIFRGVGFAHENGMVHRDLKPANILLGIEGRDLIPKVADFGLVKETMSAGSTRTGVAMGTPRYMSPEQINDAKSVDVRTDIFALGGILTFMLTRLPPHSPDADELFTVFNAVMNGVRTPVAELRPETPQRMLDAIDGAMAIDREDRFSSVQQLAEVFFGTGVADRGWSAEVLDRRTPGPAPVQESYPASTEPTFLPPETPVPAPREPTAVVVAEEMPTLPPVDDVPPPPDPAVARVSAVVPLLLLGAVAVVTLLVVVFALMVFQLGGGTAEPVTPEIEVPRPIEPTPVDVRPEPVEPVEPVEVIEPDSEPSPDPTLPPPVVAPVPPPRPEPVAPAPVKQPKPEPAVAEADVPEPIPEPVIAEPVAPITPAPVPVPTKASFTVVGARGTLKGGGKEFAPGKVPPGSYTWWAFFDKKATKGGPVTLRAGDSFRLKCDSALTLCDFSHSRGSN